MNCVTDKNMVTKSAVFLDRDGTISEEMGYINHVDRLKLIPGAAQAIRRLNQRGIPTIVITNQAGVARGYFPERLVQQVNERLEALLAAEGAHLDGIYYCPHHPAAGKPPYRRQCNCRKPQTGLVERAIKDLQLQNYHYFVVGDKYSDMLMARNFGADEIFVLTGYGKGELELFGHTWDQRPAKIAADLAAAVDLILEYLDVNNDRTTKN